MSDDGGRPESGLTDDDFSSVWTDDDRPRIPRVAGEREAVTAYLAVWRAECEVSRRIVADHELDDTARPLDWFEDVDLRWLLLRMIREYAQHCGHAYLLREAIDGRTGS